MYTNSSPAQKRKGASRVASHVKRCAIRPAKQSRHRLDNESLEMFILSRKMSQVGSNGCLSSSTATYENAVKALNGLQSNAAYLNRVRKHDPISNNQLHETRKYLLRSGISLERLDNLSVIHVAGTKGKGSTCAFAESLLRAHGVRTGLYTSPHLVSVRERLRINGKPIDEEKFTKYFWRVYNRLEKGREHEGDMPQYFKFLTLLMFHVFLEAPIDVAIIEVGIGGELDCTNVVRNPVCVGITSLGLEHTNLLGDTLESIAYQKSGIFKRGATALSVPQPEEAMRVLDKRSLDKGCSLTVVPTIDSYPWSGKRPVLGIAGEFQNYNASLAIGMTRAWLESNHERTPFSFETAASALSRCKWPGRTQILRGERIDFYLDGAHTVESIDCCVSWFRESTKHSDGKRVLVFNTTGNRDSAKLLTLLRPVNFQRAYFVPNVAGNFTRVDQINYTVSGKEQIERCQKHCDIWGEGSVRGSNVSEVLDRIAQDNRSSEKINLLITGSLHLVGAVIAVIDPDLMLSMRS